MLSCSSLVDRLQSVTSPQLLFPLSLNSTLSLFPPQLPSSNFPLKVATFLPRRVAAESFSKPKERISEDSRDRQDSHRLFLLGSWDFWKTFNSSCLCQCNPEHLLFLHPSFSLCPPPPHPHPGLWTLQVFFSWTKTICFSLCDWGCVLFLSTTFLAINLDFLFFCVCVFSFLSQKKKKKKFHALKKKSKDTPFHCWCRKNGRGF